ncbi:hypothetical protein DAI22_05g000400 [Oryza sativa Japonica Group]|uniref:Uncharacterized protein n=1 Tax=Oryza sativa subsp. japonica TaxID=39947 RepID=Q5KQE2_ORYSJ|nr:unknown protein [Oryza sativa Japonica Group]KAF2928654.1 hypothetical protein DAI22_05g000400 [Oryza sativa Japonica Group]
MQYQHDGVGSAVVGHDVDGALKVDRGHRRRLRRATHPDAAVSRERRAGRTPAPAPTPPPDLTSPPGKGEKGVEGSGRRLRCRREGKEKRGGVHATSRARAADNEGEDGAAPVGLRRSVASAYGGHPPPSRRLLQSPDPTAALDLAAGVATAPDREGRAAAATSLPPPDRAAARPPSKPPPPSTSAGFGRREGSRRWIHPSRSHSLEPLPPQAFGRIRAER